MYTASLSDARIALRTGFVYCAFAPRFRAAYVGQTWGYQGALGRLTQHLAERGTFRTRLCENFGYDEIDIGPVVFEACELDPARPEFHDRARDHREAVEGRTQYELLNRLAQDRTVSCVVVSRVALNAYARADYVQAAAATVVDRIYERARTLMVDPAWGQA